MDPVTTLARLGTLLAAIAMVTAGVPSVGLLGTGPSKAAAQTGDLLEQAEIVRDAYGVAHIYTDNEQALWYANGYVQAQDRLWAMDLLRHISYGEGASVVGPGGGILEMDLDTRRSLYNESQLQAQYEDADPRFKQAISSYTEGVNRAAAEMHATGEMPAEFQALQHAFEPWDEIDTVAVATFLLARFGNGGGAEVANAQLLEQLRTQLGDAGGDVAIGDLVWGERDDSYATIQDEYPHSPHANVQAPSSMPSDQKEATQAATEAVPLGPNADPLLPSPPSTQAAAGAGARVPDVGLFAGRDIGPEDFRLGSNALVVAPSLSETGEALLGGGPQMGYFNPQIPYEIGLHYEPSDPQEGLEAEGMGVTGAPGVIIGRSDDFAVTVTSGNSDQTDTIALPAAEEGNRSYVWDGEARQLDCRTERHRVFTPPALWVPATAGDPGRAQLPVQILEQEVCRADLGPTDKTYPVTHVTRGEDGQPEWFFAKKSTARMEEVDSAIQWLTLMEADDFEEFQSHFEGFAFTFNFHYAGVKDGAPGDEAACFVHVGRQPVRVDALDPRFPTPGGDDWLWGPGEEPTYLTGDELPRKCNPSRGYFVNWNNLPQQGWSSGDARELWGSIHRAERLDKEVQEAIDPDGDHEVENLLNLSEVQGILEDAATEDSLAHQIVPLLTQGSAPHTPDGAEAALEAWAEGSSDSDYPWRAGTPGTPPDQATVSNASDEGYTGASELVYVDPGHTVYDRVLPAILEEIFGDELGPHVRDVNIDPRNSSDPHAGDHGQHNNPFSIVVDALNGNTDRSWCDNVTTQAQESCLQQVRQAFQKTGFEGVAMDDIELTRQHLSPFTSLGVGPAYEIPMTNRATFYHFHVGTDTTSSLATLPAGVSGHMNAADFLQFTATGEEPEHMRDQLDLYVDFEFKDLAWTQSEAEEDADTVQSLLVPAS